MAKSPDIKKKTSMIEIFLTYLAGTPIGKLFLHLLWIVVASCALSSSYILAFHFTSLVAIYEEAHNIRNFSNNLRITARQDQEINTILTGLLEKAHSTRAYVFRYHNGLAAVNGVPFFFQTNTHEVISPGTSRVIQFEQHIPASINIAMNNQFMANRCAMVSSANEDRDSQNYWYFQNRSAKSLVRCPIFMGNGDLFGFVGIDFSESIDSDRLAQLANEVKTASTAVGLLFATKH
jgi:hypothetical protein